MEVKNGNLVTKKYLDNALDKRFEEYDLKIDKRFEEFGLNVNRRFDEHDRRFDFFASKLYEHDRKFNSLENLILEKHNEMLNRFDFMAKDIKDIKLELTAVISHLHRHDERLDKWKKKF